jgi:hypothetical protein
MITRSVFQYSNRAGTAASLAQGWSLSLPHPSFVTGHPKANMATRSGSVFACFHAMTEAAITAQGLDIDRMAVAVADRGCIAGVQRP